MVTLPVTGNHPALSVSLSLLFDASNVIRDRFAADYALVLHDSLRFFRRTTRVKNDQLKMLPPWDFVVAETLSRRREHTL